MILQSAGNNSCKYLPTVIPRSWDYDLDSRPLLSSPESSTDLEQSHLCCYKSLASDCTVSLETLFGNDETSHYTELDLLCWELRTRRKKRWNASPANSKTLVMNQKLRKLHRNNSPRWENIFHFRILRFQIVNTQKKRINFHSSFATLFIIVQTYRRRSRKILFKYLHIPAGFKYCSRLLSPEQRQRLWIVLHTEL